MAGERHESLAFEPVMDMGVVPQGDAPGRPRLRPRAVVGDKALEQPAHPRLVPGARHVRCVIPTLGHEKRRPGFDKAACRERNRVEHLINRLKQCRRVATRYDKRAAHYLAFVLLAAVLLWL